MKHKIIAFSGNEGSGKSTVAQYTKFILDHDPDINKEVIILPLALPIKEFGVTYFGWDERRSNEDHAYKDVYDDSDFVSNKLGMSRREFFVRFGEGLKKIFENEDFFSMIAEVRMQRNTTPSIYIIPDIRRESEKQWVEQHGGTTILIKSNTTTDMTHNIGNITTPFDMEFFNNKELGHHGLQEAIQTNIISRLNL